MSVLFGRSHDRMTEDGSSKVCGKQGCPKHENVVAARCDGHPGFNVPAAKGMSAFGTKRTSQPCRSMSAFGGKADMTRTCSDVGFCPKADILRVAARTVLTRGHRSARREGRPTPTG